MATATATAEVTTAKLSRWTYLLAYLGLVIVAEILIAIPGPPNGEGRPWQPIGLSMHILLVFTLMFLSVFLQAKDAPLASLLVAVSLASLVRVFSLAVPRFAFIATPESNVFNTIPWLALVSVPLLVSVAAVAYVQGLRPRDLGLLIRRAEEVPLQLAVALTGTLDSTGDRGPPRLGRARDLPRDWPLGGTHLPRDPLEASDRGPRRALRPPLRDGDFREPAHLLPERHRPGVRLRGRALLRLRGPEDEKPLGRHPQPQPWERDPVPGRAVPLAQGSPRRVRSRKECGPRALRRPSPRR